MEMRIFGDPSGGGYRQWQRIYQNVGIDIVRQLATDSAGKAGAMHSEQQLQGPLELIRRWMSSSAAAGELCLILAASLIRSSNSTNLHGSSTTHG